MKKFLSQISIFAIICLIGMFVLDLYFTSVFQDGKTNKTQWLDRIEDQHYDYALIGSSRAWWNIDIGKINNDTGLNGISLANNHFSYSEMTLRLKRMRENGNSIDHLYVQTEYWNFFSSKENLSITAYNYLPFLDDPTTYNHLKKKSYEWMIYKYVPFWRYAEYNHQYGLEEVLITELGIRNSIFDENGAFFSNDKFYGSLAFKVPDPTSRSIHPDFIELLDYCDRENIQLHFYTSPVFMARTYPEAQAQFEFKLDSLELPYVNHMNYFNSVGDSIYFNDNSHLSIKGGERFTEQMKLELEKLNLQD